MTIKLPYNWYNFKIVETSEGCFTGQVTCNDEDTVNFNDDKRKELVRYTREYIEENTGKKVEQYTPNLRD